VWQQNEASSRQGFPPARGTAAVTAPGRDARGASPQSGQFLLLPRHLRKRAQAAVESAAPVWHNHAILTETEFVLHGNLGELKRLAAETARFCREESLSGEVEFDLNLVLEELFTNSVTHGGCAGMENAVQVRLQVRDNGVLLEYSDRGRPFDPLTAPEPDLEAPLQERGIGGLGVHLVRQIMRDVDYRRADGWNRIVMRRVY
jgi:anti-sigma regulatory factor (Ser/Thr protein kinase)